MWGYEQERQQIRKRSPVGGAGRFGDWRWPWTRGDIVMFSSVGTSRMAANGAPYNMGKADVVLGLCSQAAGCVTGQRIECDGGG